MEAAVESSGRLPRAIRYGVVGGRVAVVVTSRLRAEAGRERFARIFREEGLRRPYRSYSLLVALGDGPLRNAALLEGVLGCGDDRANAALRCTGSDQAAGRVAVVVL